MKNFSTSRLIGCSMAGLLAMTASAALTEMGPLKGYSSPLASGVYTVSEATTFTGTDGASGLAIKSGANVILVFSNNATLAATGSQASTGYTGSGAGIEIPSNASLVLVGSGTVTATGAAAQAGGSGGSGDRAVSGKKAGYGGSGGYGGGGAGAAIGSSGGEGGNKDGVGAPMGNPSEVTKESSSGYTSPYIVGAPELYTENESSHAGCDGKSSASFGTLAVYGSGMKVTLTPGAANATTGSDGGLESGTATSTSDFNSLLTYKAYYGYWGTGGFGGAAAQAFGGGGAGGGGGASGAGGYIFWECLDEEGMIKGQGNVGSQKTGNAEKGAMGGDAVQGVYYAYDNPTVTATSGTVSNKVLDASAPGCYTITFKITSTKLKRGPAAQTVIYGYAAKSIGRWRDRYGRPVTSWKDSSGNVLFNQAGEPTFATWTYTDNVTLTPTFGAQTTTLPEKGELSGFTSAPLESGIYTVSKSLTLAPTTAGASGLTVSNGAQVVLYFKDSATLTTTGVSGGGATGSGAGILLPSGSELVLTGQGKVVATGAAASNGGDYGQGGTGGVSGSSFYGGYGGKGGDGGGGAGAAIGTSGGAGGGGAAVSARAEESEGELRKMNELSKSGNDGSDAAASGQLLVYGSDVAVTLTAGAAATTDGADGAYTSDYRVMGLTRYCYKGQPGHGGLRGLAAQACGTGGGGGGGGSSGAGGYVFVTGSEKYFGSTNVNWWAEKGSSGTASTADTYFAYGSPTVTATGATATSEAADTNMLFVSTIHFATSAGVTLASIPTNVVVAYGAAYPTIGTVRSATGVRVSYWVDEDGMVYYDTFGRPVFAEYPLLTDVTLYPLMPPSDTGVSINGTEIDTSTEEGTSGTGWTYDAAECVLHLTGENQTFALSGTNEIGQMSVSVESTCAMTLEKCGWSAVEETLPGIIALKPGIALTLNCTGSANCLDASDVSGMNAIYCPSGSTFWVEGPAPMYTHTAPESMATGMGTYTAASTTPCLVAKSQDETVIGGNAKAIPYSGYMNFTNCVVSVSATKSGVRGIGTATSETGKHSRLITFYRGIGIQGNQLVYPRPHDEYDMPLYSYAPSTGNGLWLPAGVQTVSGSTVTVTHTGSAAK